MTHTPGPWIKDEKVISDSEGEITMIVFCPDGPGYGRVAQVYAECGRNTELLPNARLIAAAPELLEALEVAIGCVEYMAGAIDSDPEDHERLAIVENAIKQAKGN